MNRTIYLLLDYRNCFYASTRTRGASIHIGRLGGFLEKCGYELRTKRFHEIDFREQDYRDAWIVYQSSEDRDLFYKNYIEDVLLGLQLQGARLIPDFYKFRAHHNKVFMEIYRDTQCPKIGKTIKAKGYGTLEEFQEDLPKHAGKRVMKPCTGALSAGVRLVDSDQEKLRHAARLSRSVYWKDWCKNFINRIVRKNYVSKSSHRKGFIVQEYIPALTGDYKVLVYGDKYYVLCRKVRKGDFRASGSGIFSYPEEKPDKLLSFAEKLFLGFNVPFVSLDVAEAMGSLHLLEFQFISFGNYTLEKSECYYRHGPDGWEQLREVPDLEREVAASLVSFIERQAEKTGNTITRGHEAQ